MADSNLEKAKEMLRTGEASISQIKEILLNAHVNPAEVDEIISKLEKDESGKKQGFLEICKIELRKGKSLNEVDSMLKSKGISKDLRIELLKELETFKQELKEYPSSNSNKASASSNTNESTNTKKHKWLIYVIVALVIAVIVFFIYSRIKNGS